MGTHQCSIAYQAHDHHHCIDDALGAAKALCTAQGVNLTPLREDVLTLVWQSHKPLGAYDILEALSKKENRRTAPPTVYRALEFLQAQGLVHRLATLNAYIGCCHPEKPHSSQFLICGGCGITVEVHNARDKHMVNQTHGFKIDSISIEAVGLCPTCQQKVEK
jgi:Fur family zinc uptake transcriptional regulator